MNQDKQGNKMKKLDQDELLNTQFMESLQNEPMKNLIAGEWVETPEIEENVNPSDTSDIVSTFYKGSFSHIFETIDCAAKVQQDWAKSSIALRQEILNEVAVKLLENKDLKILAGVDTVTVHAGLAGACGGITGVGNIFPKASLTMQEYVLKGEWDKANKISQALNSLSYLDAQPLLLEYLKLAMGIHYNDVAGGLRTFGKNLTTQQIDEVRTRYSLTKERLQKLDLQ